ncbi:MAG: hypothetical protein IPJ68_02750 [Candidatus Moraniibacteriota bacterium]|nr:MAG: hypothetical protein IPJ68_02750 [Candidatus Moranbacteria bacterium]
MELDLEAKLNALAERQELMAVAVEKTRKYMLWSFIMQLAVVVLPLVVLMFAIPFLLSSLSNLSGLYQGL